MRLRSLFLTAVVAGTAFAAAAPAAIPEQVGEGLTRVSSRTLDELYVRPQADLRAYRQVMIDSPRVELQTGWLKRMNETRDVTRWLVPADAQQIADDAALAMRSAVAAAFEARGYKIATAPGSGVLRLSPTVTDLFVNAPDVPAPGIQVGVVYQEGGTATLRLDAHDAVTGALIGQVVDRDTAREVRNFNRATRVSNNFWFEAMFRQWAQNCAREFEAAGTAP